MRRDGRNSKERRGVHRKNERTSTKFLHQIPTPQPTYVPPTKPPQQAHARPQRIERRGNEMDEGVGLAVEEDSDESAAGLGELVNDVDAVWWKLVS